MHFLNFLSKIYYWNSILSNRKKFISLKSLHKKIFNCKYLFICFIKNNKEKESLFLSSNIQYIDIKFFQMSKQFLNKKQKIIVLNNPHEISTIIRDLQENNYKIILVKEFKKIYKENL